MNVEEAEAQLAFAKAKAKFADAKEAYHADPTAENKPAFRKAQKALVAARNEWRINWRKSPDGPGDGVADPDPVGASVEVS